MHLVPKHFMKTATAGTEVRLTTADIKTPAVLIQAERSNTGYVYLGQGPTMSSSSYGIDLAAADSVSITAKDFGMAGANISLKEIWMDVSVSTDGVSVFYLERAE